MVLASLCERYFTVYAEKPAGTVSTDADAHIKWSHNDSSLATTAIYVLAELARPFSKSTTEMSARQGGRALHGRALPIGQPLRFVVKVRAFVGSRERDPTWRQRPDV